MRPPKRVLVDEASWKIIWNFPLNWLQNCFVELENKSAYQNLKIELYLGMFRSNNDTLLRSFFAIFNS